MIQFVHLQNIRHPAFVWSLTIDVQNPNNPQYVLCIVDQKYKISHAIVDEAIKQITEPQIDDYGYRIQQDPPGKTRKSHRILQESTGNNRKWAQYYPPPLSAFF